ncbi:MAG: hypothetical protein RLZZ156_1410 [Deinococcota bacterium]|jgi:hypothetical protein
MPLWDQLSNNEKFGEDSNDPNGSRYHVPYRFSRMQNCLFAEALAREGVRYFKNDADAIRSMVFTTNTKNFYKRLIDSSVINGLRLPIKINGLSYGQTLIAMAPLQKTLDDFSKKHYLELEEVLLIADTQYALRHFKRFGLYGMADLHGHSVLGTPLHEAYEIPLDFKSAATVEITEEGMQLSDDWYKIQEAYPDLNPIKFLGIDQVIADIPDCIIKAAPYGLRSHNGKGFGVNALQQSGHLKNSEVARFVRVLEDMPMIFPDVITPLKVSYGNLIASSAIEELTNALMRDLAP